ncbi:hypothetical protein D3C81_1337440 [compost metagenome]
MTPATCTPPTSDWPGVGAISKITCLARYGWPFGATALSALARLEAVTFIRCDCAAMAEPATSKMFMLGMVGPR